jgi:hypothetical protein
VQQLPFRRWCQRIITPKPTVTAHPIAASASIKGEEPIAIVHVIAHKTNPGQTIFIGAGVYMWWVLRAGPAHAAAVSRSGVALSMADAGQLLRRGPSQPRSGHLGGSPALRHALPSPAGPGPPNRVSKDFGETLTPVKNPGGFKGAHVTVRANRQQPDWLLALAKRPDCHSLDDYQIRCPSDLFVAKVRRAGGSCISRRT